jgi:hypothetical protein
MKKSHLIICFLGVALFIWVVAHVSLAELARELRAIRTALPFVLALSICRLVLQSIAWSASLDGQSASSPMKKLMGVRLASQSMGYLTVLGPLLSEPMKIKLLGTPTGPTVAATFLDDGVYWFTSILVAISGIVSLFLVVVHAATIHWAAAVLVLASVVFVIKRREPILSSAVRALGKRTPSWLTRAEEFEASVRTYRVQQPALVKQMFWLDIACQILIACEVAVVLWSLHLPIHFFTVLAIEGVTRSVKLASGFIPARLGSDEGGAVSAFALAGFSSALGLALALTRRVRDLLWALVGISWLFWNSRRLQLQDASAPVLAAFPEEALQCRQS